MSKENSEKTPFFKYLESKINDSSIKQVDIAEKLGYENPNVVTMFKQGRTKVPLHKIPTFAEILKIDPNALFRMALEEYDPKLLKTIDNLSGFSLVTKNEMAIVKRIRHSVDDHVLDTVIENTNRAISEFTNKLTNSQA